MAYSADGKRLLTGSGDYAARIWDLEQYALPCSSSSGGAQGQHPRCDLLKDERYVATASDDNTARVWDVQTGQVPGVRGHQDRVRAVSFSPDARLLATSSDDKPPASGPGMPRVRVISTLRGHTARVRSAQFSPAGDFGDGQRGRNDAPVVAGYRQRADGAPWP